MDINDINILRLRKDLEDYYLGIMFNVSPAALVDLSKLDRLSDEEICELAIENGFNLDEYNVNKK